MKVILEAQYACTATPWGIPYYVIQLYSQLLTRNKNNYELTFFDFNKECNNLQYINKYFGEFKIPIHECNTLDYRVSISDSNAFSDISYNDYTEAFGDIFHFAHLVSVPDNLQGRMVVTVHDLLPIKFPEFYSFKNVNDFKLNINRINKIQPFVIVDSNSTKNDVLQYVKISPEKVYVVPLACDTEQYNPVDDIAVLKNLNIDFPYLLYLGRLDVRKNVIRVLEAFESISERISGVRLVIAGALDSGADEVKSKIRNSFCKSHIILTGYVTDKQKHALYSGATAFLFPSLYEGFGLPILEAMTRGCPVITSNISSMPEVAGDAAILIDPYNTEQLAYEMERIVSSETLREELKCKGLEQCKKFSWDKTAEMTENVYKNCMLE